MYGTKTKTVSLGSKGSFKEHPGALHRALGVPEGEKIPAAKLHSAEHSDDPEIRRDAIRAKTMKGWSHSGRRAALYGKKD